MTTTELKVLPISSIVESKTNPRRHFDDVTLKELGESIKAKGILSPVLVRPVNGHFELVDGARRLRAAKAVQLPEVPAFIRQLSDEEALEIQVVANLLRDDIHPLDEAIGYDQLMKKNRYTVETVASKVGKSVSYVYQRLKLAELIEPAKKAFWSLKLTPAHAIIIARLQPKDQDRALTFALKTWQDYEGEHDYDNILNPEKGDDPPDTRCNAGEPAQTVCSVKDLADFIEKRIHLDLRKAAFDKKDTELVAKAGSCINCPKRSGFNKELFSDITRDPDICTDPVCFALKQRVHVERLKATLKKEKRKFIEVTADQRKPEGHGGAITERSFKKISGKPCKHARTGIYIDGLNMGETVTICNAKRECKQHWADYQRQRASRSTGGGAEKRESYEEEQKKRQAKVDRAFKRFRPIAEEIWKKIPTALPKKFDYVSLLVELLEDDIPQDLEQCKPKGLKLTPIQQLNIGLLCRRFGDVDVSWEGNIHPDTFKLAKAMGIKFEAILQKIENEEKAKEKANKTKEQPKKKA